MEQADEAPEAFSQFSFPAFEDVYVWELVRQYELLRYSSAIGGDETLKNSTRFDGPFF